MMILYYIDTNYIVANICFHEIMNSQCEFHTNSKCIEAMHINITIAILLLFFALY